MKGLLLRLSELDADAETSVRVIGFYDELIKSRASAETLVRETARLAECPVGLSDAAGGVVLHADAQGRLEREGIPGPMSGASLAPTLVRSFSARGRVWLERADGRSLPLDELVLERMAIAVGLALDRARAAQPELDAATLLTAVLSTDVGEPERAHALRQLRFEWDSPLHVLAVGAGADVAGVSAMTTLMKTLHAADAAACCTPYEGGRLHAVVLRAALPDLSVCEAPGGIGVSPQLPARRAPEAWRRARTALRFAAGALPNRGLVRYEELGALAPIAQRLRDEDIAEISDVGALDALAAEPHGADLLAVLGAFCEAGSARKAAAQLYRHHSTIAARIAHAEARLGFRITTPAGRLRLELALVLRALRGTENTTGSR
jgi:hypothetical protein